MRRRPLVRLSVSVVALALVASACGGGQKQGGTLVLGAEQWPECLNPITSCSEIAWLGWAVLQHVLPKAMTLDADGNYVPSPVLQEAPTLENGGIKEDPFTITLLISEDAVWDDGTPITSADFEFTWQAFLKTKGTINTLGYDAIDKIDTSDPKRVVITFKGPFAGWADIFGGNAGYVLKKAAFRGTDLSREMSTSIGFSGAAWRLQTFSKQQAILVPNPSWWGEEPNWRQVTVVPRTDPGTATTQLLSGQVQALFPSPDQSTVKRFQDDENVEVRLGAGVDFDGIWFNTEKVDKPVREAMARALPREDMVEAAIGSLNPDAKPLNCPGWVPTVGRWCDETDFADITYDPEAAKKVLQDEGYTLGSDGIFTKDGERLSLELLVTADVKPRQDAAAVIVEKAKAAGIAVDIETLPIDDLVPNRMLPGNFEMVFIGQSATVDPSVSFIYGCDQVPTEANEFGGGNIMRWCNKTASDAAAAMDTELDEDKRLDLARTVGDEVRKDLPWVPLFQNVLMTAWRSDRIGGPVGEFTSSPLGGFANVAEWEAA